MQLQVTDGYITGYAVVGGFPDGIEVPGSFLEELEPEKIGYYKYEGGKAVLDEEKYLAFQGNVEKEMIRSRRAEECFPIVNRGQVWYDLLGEEQKSELSEWYREWLDAPETKTIPERPAWIDMPVDTYALEE